MVSNLLAGVARGTSSDLWRRYLALVLDGLCRRPDLCVLGTPPPQETDLAMITQRR